jgi:hypothetical protein
MLEEEWRVIPSLPEYVASSFGRIMRVPFFGPLPNGGVRRYGGKPSFGAWDGTRFIFQYRGKSRKVHRVVCEAFHGPAPMGRTYVLHGDENSRNNRPENLSWGTQKENLNAPGFLAYCRARVGDASPVVKGRNKSGAL